MDAAPEKKRALEEAAASAEEEPAAKRRAMEEDQNVFFRRLYAMAKTIDAEGAAELFRLSSFIQADKVCLGLLAQEPTAENARTLLLTARGGEEKWLIAEDHEKRVKSVIAKAAAWIGIPKDDQRLVECVRGLPTEALKRAFSASSAEELSQAGLSLLLTAEDVSTVVSRAVGEQFSPLASELALLEKPSMDAVLHIRELVSSQLLQQLPCAPLQQQLPDDIAAWLRPSASRYSSLGDLARLQLELPVLLPRSEMDVTERLPWVFHRTLEILASLCEPSFNTQANVSPSAKKSQGAAKSPSEMKGRPDFFLGRLSSVLLIGEYKKEDLQAALADLASKVTFDAQLWFKLGLAATMNSLSLVLLADEQRLDVAQGPRFDFEKVVSSKNVRVFALKTLEFSYEPESLQAHKENRCRAVLLAINAFRLVRTFMDLAFFEFKRVGSHGVVRATWTGEHHNRAFVYEKKLTRLANVDRLCGLYQRIKTARDDSATTRESDLSLVQASIDRKHKKVVVRTPGLLRAPKDESELKDAVRSVLHALSILHRANIAHFDIRWPNIIRAFDQDTPRWVLIDLEFMQDFDEKKPPTLEARPPILADGSSEPVSAAYDIWLVGNLVGHSGVLDLSRDALEFAQALMAANPNDRPSLEDALSHAWLRAC